MSEIEELRAEVERLHSWDGLMGLLDERWPDDIFPTLPDDNRRDPGPRIVSLLRWLASEREAHAGLRARLEALADQLESVTVPSAEVTSWSRYFAARLRPILAAEPAAPMAAEEGDER